MTAADENEPEGRPDGFVQSLERGLAIIQTFSETRRRQTLADVAKAAGMPRAAARRYLITLQHLGFVGSDGHFFFLKSQILRLGYSYLSSLSLSDVAREHLEDLSARLREPCAAAVLTHDEIVYMARASATKIMAMSLGARLPAHCSDLGRVQLAYLPRGELEAFLDHVELDARTPYTITDKERLREELERVRVQGWCLVDQEVEWGVSSIAAPVRDASGVVAALNVSVFNAQVSQEKLLQEYLPALLESAALTSQELSKRWM